MSMSRSSWVIGGNLHWRVRPVESYARNHLTRHSKDLEWCVLLLDRIRQRAEWSPLCLPVPFPDDQNHEGCVIRYRFRLCIPLNQPDWRCPYTIYNQSWWNRMHELCVLYGSPEHHVVDMFSHCESQAFRPPIYMVSPSVNVIRGP